MHNIILLTNSSPELFQSLLFLIKSPLGCIFYRTQETTVCNLLNNYRYSLLSIGWKYSLILVKFDVIRKLNTCQHFFFTLVLKVFKLSKQDLIESGRVYVLMYIISIMLVMRRYFMLWWTFISVFSFPILLTSSTTQLSLCRISQQSVSCQPPSTLIATFPLTVPLKITFNYIYTSTI